MRFSSTVTRGTGRVSLAVTSGESDGELPNVNELATNAPTREVFRVHPGALGREFAEEIVERAGQLGLAGEQEIAARRVTTATLHERAGLASDQCARGVIPGAEGALEEGVVAARC